MLFRQQRDSQFSRELVNHRLQTLNQKTLRISATNMLNPTKSLENYYTEKAEAFATEASIPTSSFDKACKKLGLEKTEINAFPINYGNTGFFESLANESIISSLVRNADAYKKAFALKLGEVSSPIVLDGKVIVLKCTGTQTSKETDTAAIETAIPAIDQTSGQKTLMNSEKVVDNFFTTYLNLMNSNNR